MSGNVPVTTATSSTTRENSAFDDPRSSPMPEPKAASVNRKKQKRREKAARLAAERAATSGDAPSDTFGMNGPGSLMHDTPAPHESAFGGDDNTSEEVLDGQEYNIHELPHPSEYEPQGTPGRKSKQKHARKGRTGSHASSTPLSTPSISLSSALPPPLPPHFDPQASSKLMKERSIWNTSTQEERENIKTFWLELGEEDRRQLVKVEKDAVLKKMKEQQKHSCSCTVCGRKRTAIEEELEVLYDAYYDELEQYANTTQGTFERGPPMIPPPRLYQPPLRPPGQHTHTHGHFHPSRSRVHELPEDEEELDEEYDEDEEEDEPYSDEEYEDDEGEAARADFFAFGNSLTVKGKAPVVSVLDLLDLGLISRSVSASSHSDGILTVADDLLKNDGKHFIDMMEQLAERRMQREEDTQIGIAAAHQSLHNGHNHGPLDDEDYDEEEDEEYDSQEEEEYEEDEMVRFEKSLYNKTSSNNSQDSMTEEQRMEEGRRMFQIFAARMFEQRVLTAYREKVAEQRQQKLIQELLEEENLNEQKTAKKAREAQKRKDKKRLAKLAKDEEKARKDSEKAAEEAAAKAEQERKLEEKRRKQEEQRKKREAERKVQEAERARKEAEKLKRQREERDKQEEAERKQREQKEQEKKRREEARRKEREEHELKEQKAKQERDRKAQDEQARRERERAAQGERPLHPKRASGSLLPLPGQQQSQSTATAIPKAPTPAKGTRSSQQGSHASSPRSQSANGEASQVSPRSVPLSQSSGSSVASKHGPSHSMLHNAHPGTPISPLGRSHPPGLSPSNPSGLPGMVPRPPMGHELPSYPPHSSPCMNQARGFPAPNGIAVPPGMNGTRPIPPGRGFPLEAPGLPFHAQQPFSGIFSPQPGGLPHGHSRHSSNSFERSPLDTNAQPFPISRPSPIKRPPSSQQGQRNAGRDVDDLSAHLGSSALLDDTDIPLTSSQLSQSLPGSTPAASLPGPTRASFASSSLFPEPLSGKSILVLG